MIRSLRVLSEVPRLRVLVPLSLIGRVHLSGLPVALSFLVAGWTGSYAVVGLVTGAMAVGQAVSGPLRGKAADRSSASTLLIATGLGYAAGMIVLILVTLLLPGAFWPVAVLVSFFTGVMLPPVSQIGRSIWPRLTEGSARESLYTLEATGYEIVAMGGPVLAAGVVAVAAPWAAVVVCAALAALGALAFGLVVRGYGLDRTEQLARKGGDAEARRSLLRDPVLLRALLVSFFLMAALFSVNLSVVAWGRDTAQPGLAGVLIALWSLGSAVGGIIVAGRAAKPNVGLRIGGLAVGILVIAVLLPPVTASIAGWILVIVMLVTGTAISPSLAAGNSRIGALAPDDRRAEAFGWLATATTGGVAIMLPVTGWLLDLSGPGLSIGVGALAAVVACVLGFTLPRSRPVKENSEPVDEPAAAPEASR